MRKKVKKITEELLSKYSRQKSADKKIRRDSFNDIHYGIYLWGKYWERQRKLHPEPKISWRKIRDQEGYIKLGKFKKAIRHELKRIRTKNFLIKYHNNRDAGFDKISVNNKTKIIIVFLIDEEPRKYHLVDIYYKNFDNKKIIDLVKRTLHQNGFFVISNSERTELKKRKQWNVLFIEPYYQYNPYYHPVISDKEAIDMGVFDKKYYISPKERRLGFKYETKSFDLWLDSFILLAKEKYSMALVKFLQQSIGLIEKINKKEITKKQGGRYFKGLEYNLQQRTIEPICNSYYIRNLTVLKNLQQIINVGKKLDVDSKKSKLDKIKEMCQDKLKTKIKI